MKAAGTYDELMFTPNGPAGAFALYVSPGSNLGRVFLNEFVCVRNSPLLRFIPSCCMDGSPCAPVRQCFIISLVVWACIDPTNFSSTPTTAPWIIAFT